MPKVKEQDRGIRKLQEFNEILEKVTQDDKELAEYLSMMFRGNYLKGFVSDYPNFSSDMFNADIFVNQLTSPGLDFEYKKSMQNMFLHLVALHKFILKKIENGESKYNSLKNDLENKLLNSFIRNSDVVLMDNDFDSNEYSGFLDDISSVDRDFSIGDSEFSDAVSVFDEIYDEFSDIALGFDKLKDVVPVEFSEFYSFEHGGKKYCINSIKEMFDEYNELLTSISKEDKKELNRFINQAKSIYYDSKFGECGFEARKVIECGHQNFGQVQYYSNLDAEFWNKLNSRKIHFKSKRLNNILNEVESNILSHLHIKVNGENRFLNPSHENIPVFKNADEIHDYMKKIQKFINKLNEIKGFYKSDLLNYRNLKSELQKYYFFFANQYSNYVSFNQMPTKKDIDKLKEQFIDYLSYEVPDNSDENYSSILAKVTAKADRLFELIDTIDKPNLEKIMKLINPDIYDENQIKENLGKIIQMILVSDPSVEMLYQKGKFGYKSLNGLIYQTPEQTIEMMNLSDGQKININERLAFYLEESTDQEYLKRIIFLPDYFDISIDVYNKRKAKKTHHRKAKKTHLRYSSEKIEAENKKIAHILGIMLSSTSYKSLEDLEKSDLFNYILPEDAQFEDSNIYFITYAIDFLLERNKDGLMLNILSKLTNSSNYISKENQEEVLRISKLIYSFRDLIDAFYMQYLENAKKSSKVENTTKKQRKIDELLNKTLNSLIDKRVCKRVIDCIFKMANSNVFSENLYMLSDIINNGIAAIKSLPAENLYKIINEILKLGISSTKELELIKLVFKIAKNDNQVGLLTENVNQVLKLTANNYNDCKYYMEEIYGISEKYKYKKVSIDIISDLLDKINTDIENNLHNKLEASKSLEKRDDEKQNKKILTKTKKRIKRNSEKDQKNDFENIDKEAELKSIKKAISNLLENDDEINFELEEKSGGKSKLNQFVSEIADNDPRGVLTKNVSLGLKELSFANRIAYIKVIHDISQKYARGDYPRSIVCLLSSDDFDTKYRKLQKKVKNLQNREKPLKRLTDENSGKKQSKKILPKRRKNENIENDQNKKRRLRKKTI